MTSRIVSLLSLMVATSASAVEYKQDVALKTMSNLQKSSEAICISLSDSGFDCAVKTAKFEGPTTELQVDLIVRNLMINEYTESYKLDTLLPVWNKGLASLFDKVVESAGYEPNHSPSAEAKAAVEGTRDALKAVLGQPSAEDNLFMFEGNLEGAFSSRYVFLVIADREAGELLVLVTGYSE